MAQTNLCFAHTATSAPVDLLPSCMRGHTGKKSLSFGIGSTDKTAKASPHFFVVTEYQPCTLSPNNEIRTD